MNLREGFLKPLKCFIPQREMRSISSRGPIVFTYVLFWVREGISHFQKSIGFLKIFEPRKCFIPLREMRSTSSRGPIVFTYVLFWVKEGI